MIVDTKLVLLHHKFFLTHSLLANLKRERQWTCLNYEQLKDENWQSNICCCYEAILGTESLNVFVVPRFLPQRFLWSFELHYNLICPRGYSNSFMFRFVCDFVFPHRQAPKYRTIPRAFVVCRTYNGDDEGKGKISVVCSLWYLYLNIYNSRVIQNYVILANFRAHVFPIHWKLWINFSLVSFLSMRQLFNLISFHILLFFLSRKIKFFVMCQCSLNMFRDCKVG